MGTRASTRHRAAGWVGIATIAAWLAASLLSLPANAQATLDDEAPARVGRIADVGGDVYHAPEDRASDWSAIGLNYPIASGDNLWIAEGGRAEIDVGVAQLRLGGETNVHVARLDDRAMAFFLAQGQAIVRLRALEAGEVARIDTPNTQIVLTRPGLYRIDVTPDRLRTTLVVREGEATMPTQGGMQQVLPGQTAQADGLDATFVDVRHGIATDGFDTWSANRDRRYQRRTATQYVSPQMVGYSDLDDYGRWENDATYGAVWYPTLGGDPDWAPYRNGYWTNVSVYGWTWVDAAPWGYAPSHYGRWVHNGGRWGWCPGAYIARPYWAPAIVGWASSSANGATPIEPSPIVVCRSRLEPHSSRESLACTSPSRFGPTVASRASRVAVIPPGTQRSCPAAHAWQVSKQTPTSGWFSSAAKYGPRSSTVAASALPPPAVGSISSRGAESGRASSTGSSRSCSWRRAAS